MRDATDASRFRCGGGGGAGHVLQCTKKTNSFFWKRKVNQIRRLEKCTHMYNINVIYNQWNISNHKHAEIGRQHWHTHTHVGQHEVLHICGDRKCSYIKCKCDAYRGPRDTNHDINHLSSSGGTTGAWDQRDEQDGGVVAWGQLEIVFFWGGGAAIV